MNNSCNQLPLAGKCFFIDPKVERNVGLNIKQSLVQLGGKVEEFLDKGVHFALTNDTTTNSGQKKCRPRPVVHSPFNTAQPSPNLPVKYPSNSNNKWKNLAKQAGKRVSSSNVIDTAKNLGIKIRTISEVWSWLNKKTEELSKSGEASFLRPSEIKLKDPCLKIEDCKRRSKPLYEEFDSFYHLDVSIKGNMCPIMNASLPSVKHHTTKRRKVDQKGFCECCQSSYLNERKHYKSTEHNKFGETSTHYEKLDEYLSTNQLDLMSLLDRHSHCIKESSSVEENEKITATLSSETIESESSAMMPNVLLYDTRSKDESTQKSVINSSTPTKTMLALRRTSPRKLARVNYASSPKKISAASKSANYAEVTLKRGIPERSSSEERVKRNFSLNSTISIVPRSSKKRSRSSLVDPISQIVAQSRIEVSIPNKLHLSSPNKRKCITLTNRSSQDDFLMSDFPCIRLRSNRRKITDVVSVENQTDNAQNSQSSDDLMVLLKTSMRDPLSESSFLGF